MIREMKRKEESSNGEEWRWREGSDGDEEQ